MKIVSTKKNPELWALARWLWNFKNEPMLWQRLPDRVKEEYYDRAEELKARFKNGVFNERS